MARTLLIKTSEFPYHVRGRTNNKEWFSVSMDECWSIFEEVLNDIHQKFNAQVGSFVLMSNHFHMVLWTPDENLDRVMNYFMHRSSFLINKKSNKINHVYGARYKWSLIKNDIYLTNVYKYNYLNPVRAKICQKPEDYRYSTLFFLVRGKKLKFPIFDDRMVQLSQVPGKIIERLKWLHEYYSDEQNQMIKKGINRSIFDYPKHKQYRNIVKTLELHEFQK